MDESHEVFVGDDALFDKRAAEMQKKLTRRDGSAMTLAQSKRASELQRDITAWEENRLFRSGVVSLREVTSWSSCAGPRLCSTGLCEANDLRVAHTDRKAFAACGCQHAGFNRSNDAFRCHMLSEYIDALAGTL